MHARWVIVGDSCLCCFVCVMSSWTPLFVDFCTGIPDLVLADCIDLTHTTRSGTVLGILLMSSSITCIPTQDFLPYLQNDKMMLFLSLCDCLKYSSTEQANKPVSPFPPEPSRFCHAGDHLTFNTNSYDGANSYLCNCWCLLCSTLLLTILLLAPTARTGEQLPWRLLVPSLFCWWPSYTKHCQC